MRWLFLFVLSLNLAYIGLEMSRSSSGSYEDVPALKNVQTIILLSELKSQSDLVQVEESIEVVTDSELLENSLAEQVDAESEVTAAEQFVAAGSDSGQTVAVPQESIKEPEVVPSPVASTLTENTVTKPPVSVEQEKSIKPSAVVLQQSVSCFTLGPFRDLAKLRGLTREIKSYVVEADFRGREEKEPTLYWVYLKPEKNRTQAIKTGKRLKAKKIKDFYVIRDGEKINGLSLGHFRSKKGAYRLAKKVKNLGFDVVVEQVFRTYTLYWLDYQLVAGATIPEAVFDKYTRSSKKEKVTRLSRDCGG